MAIRITTAPVQPVGRDWLGFFRFAYLAVASFASGMALCLYLSSAAYQLVLSSWPAISVEGRLNNSGYNQPKAPLLDQLGETDRKALQEGRLESISVAGWQTIAYQRPQDEAETRRKLTHEVVWEARRQLVESAIGFLIATLVFAFHWRLFRPSMSA